MKMTDPKIIYSDWSPKAFVIGFASGFVMGLIFIFFAR